MAYMITAECVNCSACEQECPIGIEYIDKMVDLRRGMVDEGMVPQSLQKPLGALEKRGNPWGKMERKRADWTKDLAEEAPVKIFEKGKEILVDDVIGFKCSGTRDFLFCNDPNKCCYLNKTLPLDLVLNQRIPFFQR